ncbi:ComF family protein [Romboutsia sp. 13368]|uniref:ComF family protein n=1 Tax=Romboutsia sp. 13368 TaxID=2708053 RepID=UPI0025DF1359|nr:ComF family protein [Romboutsia sp. 13368]
MIKNNFFNIFINAINILLEFLYPDNINCILCDNPINKTNTYSMCKECFTNISFILDGCVKCGKPIINYSLEDQNIEGCNYCLNKGFYFDKVISCIEYTQLSKKIVFGLKYNNKTYMSKYIAQIMKEKLELEDIKFDYILFVPLHKKRMRKRGFNQAEKIARNLSDLVNVPIIDKIDRKYNTRRLYILNKEERKKELKNAFILKEVKENLKNKNILLVDDIFTTGSTVNEISKLIRVEGVNKIFIMTFLTRV